MISFEELERKYRQVQEKVAEAAIKSGRAPEDVLLLPGEVRQPRPEPMLLQPGALM